MDDLKEDKTEEPQTGQEESESKEDELVWGDDNKEVIEEEADENEHEEDEEIKEEREVRKVGSDTQESVAFYPNQVKKKGRKTLYLIVILVLILAFLGFFFRQKIKSLVIPEATPSPSPIGTSNPSPALTPTPNPLIRSEWSFEVLNGTTTTGLAKKLDEKLKQLGYVVVKTGNADKQNYSTTQILVKEDLISKVDLVIVDLKDTIKISSMAGELTEGTASARIIIGKDSNL